MLYYRFSALYHSLELVALDSNDLWNDQLNSFLDSEYESIIWH